MGSVGWPQYLERVALVDKLFERGWRELPRASTPLAEVTYIEIMIWFDREWQQAMASKNASPSRLWRALDFTGKAMDYVRKRTEEVNCGTTSLAGRSDAAYSDQSTEGKC